VYYIKEKINFKLQLTTRYKLSSKHLQIFSSFSNFAVAEMPLRKENMRLLAMLHKMWQTNFYDT
jgi:hypothetical protein